MLINSLKLLVASYDIERLERCVVSLSDTNYVPISIQINEEDESIPVCLQNIFEQHIDLSFGWTRPILVDLAKEDNEIIAFYACNIPPGTKLMSAYYISTNMAFIDSHARKSLAYV